MRRWREFHLLLTEKNTSENAEFSVYSTDKNVKSMWQEFFYLKNYLKIITSKNENVFAMSYEF